MLFHSDEFFFFFFAFLLAYYLVQRSVAARNALILVGSYIFYGWWDYRFVGLLFFSSLMDFSLGLALGRCRRSGVRRSLVGLCLVVNLGLLGFFKYADFFRGSFETTLNWMGIPASWGPLGIILPIGISFYTFQSVSYVIDVYRGVIPATSNPVDFLAYVAFFPQLVAGPIERATRLLPQFQKPLQIGPEHLERGVWLILWGLFEKLVLADHFAPLVDLVYNQTDPGAPLVMLGTIAFYGQIYCDFSAYSDIARGVAALLGFDLMVNFDLPFVARDLREFWRRWHISLSSWFRDYVYFPLGGGRVRSSRTYLNLGLTMLLAGFWHGAAARFLLWGAWHGLGLIVNHWWIRRKERRTLPSWLAWTATSLFVCYGWLLFRAASLEQIRQFTVALTHWKLAPGIGPFLADLTVLTLPLLAIQAWQYRRRDLLAPLRLPFWGQALLQGGLLLLIAVFWGTEASPFIYFQF